MKLNYKQIVTFVNVTNGMVGKKLPLKLSFALKRNRQLADEVLKPYNEQVKEIIEAHKDDVEHTTELLDELLKEEVELDIKTVPVELIEKTEVNGFDVLTLGELEAVDFMIEA